ncbi:YqaA family protein [Thiohalorhabdus sp. Cl-TMA]|uniref:YqaA family protein n=1 Tax=Thiohalorhabdus methylotrophus TaxID=3242694 RepID=A0ABV4TYK6_9GAMM
MIRRLVHWSLVKAGHPRAPLWLGTLSFAESSVFPVPPDVLMAPMALARPRKAWYFAALTTVTSVLGGLVGYLIGALLYQAVAEPLLAFYGAREEYARVVEWFGAYGGWAVFLAGLTPIPYKVFTIGAGSLQMPLLPFVVGSLAGRGLRFFVLAGIIRVGGERLYQQVERWSPAVFWTGLAALAGLVLYSFYSGG